MTRAKTSLIHVHPYGGEKKKKLWSPFKTITASLRVTKHTVWFIMLGRNVPFERMRHLLCEEAWGRPQTWWQSRNTSVTSIKIKKHSTQTRLWRWCKPTHTFSELIISWAMCTTFFLFISSSCWKRRERHLFKNYRKRYRRLTLTKKTLVHWSLTGSLQITMMHRFAR